MKTVNLFEKTHRHVIEMLLYAVDFTSAHFKKWEASIDFELADDEGEHLLPKDILISALLTATSDTERYWSLVLSKGEGSGVSVSYCRNVDDYDIGEFGISLFGRKIDGKRSYRFGYDRKGNLLYGDDAVLGLTQEEIWGEFYSMIAKA